MPQPDTTRRQTTVVPRRHEGLVGFGHLFLVAAPTTIARMASGVGTALWWARMRAGLSQKDLADAVGAARQTISDVERGAAIPSVSLAISIAAHVGRPVEDLFGGNDAR
jgi:putative transcriptional regulator